MTKIRWAADLAAHAHDAGECPVMEIRWVIAAKMALDLIT
jgi:hypothetical protein